QQVTRRRSPDAVARRRAWSGRGLGRAGRNATSWASKEEGQDGRRASGRPAPHEHADHTHGIDDLRGLALHNRKRVNVYFTEETGARLHEAFGYCFTSPVGSEYPPILNSHHIAPGQVLEIDGPGGSISVTVFEQEHGNISSLGFRIGKLAYSCDLSGFPEASFEAISDLGVWIIDALRRAPHPSHLSLSETLDWIERFAPHQAVLTNMHVDLDYVAVDAETPHNVTPGFDGMRIDALSGALLNR
ncbi:MAG TPA: MBL fold metallo-hydrolase, partial [Devosia sp.]|nr:MBL fold metallo-hydrolase [Devosia sp.]